MAKLVETIANDNETNLKKLFESIYNKDYEDLKMTVTDYHELKVVEEKVILCKFKLHIVNKGEESTQDLEFSLPASDNELVSVDGKSRVQITSAKYSPAYVIESSFIKVHPVFINTAKDTVSWSYWDSDLTSLESLCKYLGIYSYVYPSGNETEVKPLTQVEVDKLSGISLSQELVNKIECVTKGEIVLKKDRDGIYHFDGDVLKLLIKVQRDPTLRDKFMERMPFDYEFMTALDGLAYEILEKKKMINANIMFNFNKNGRVYPTVVQDIINRYFRLQASNFRDVQVAKSSNAISMISQSKKLYFYDKSKDTGQWEKIREYNNSFLGILDPSRSSDGPLININNEMTLDTRIYKGEVLIKVYDKKFNLIEIPYMEYTRGGVLLTDYVDYTTKKMAMVNGKYVYLKYSSYMETTDENDFKYIKTQENRLTASTSVIPFYNRMAPNRGLLTSHFMDQSIPVVGAKPAAIHTSYTSKYYKESPYNTKCDMDGKVIDIGYGYVKVEGKDGKIRLYGDGNESVETGEHTTNEFNPTVKVGDTVKSGDVIIAMNSFVDGEFTTSVPLYAMFGTYLGYEHEDGIILTEEAAEKFTHMQTSHLNHSPIYEVSFIEPEDKERFNRFSVINVGQKVEPGDVLFTYYEYPDEKDSEVKLATSLMTDMLAQGRRIRRKFEYKAPLDIIHGIVKDVHVYINKLPSHIIDNSVTSFIEHYEQINKKDKADYKKMVGKNPDEFVFARESSLFTIVFTIKYMSTMEIDRLSGKITNLYGSKGLNGLIIPKEEAPIDEFGNKIECIISATNMYSRKNPNQVIEMKLGLVCIEGWKYIKKHGIDDKVARQLLDLIYPNGYKDANVINDGESYGYLRITVDPFDRYYTVELILECLKLLGLGDGNSKVFYPKFNKWTQLKNTVGLISIMRLHFLQEKKAKASSEVSFETDNDNITYMNASKEGGQKVGSMEVWALMSHGEHEVLKGLQNDYDTKKAKFESALLMLGMKLRTKNDV